MVVAVSFQESTRSTFSVASTRQVTPSLGTRKPVRSPGRRGRRRALLPLVFCTCPLSVLLVYIVEVDGPPSPPAISAFPSPSFVAASTSALFIDLTAIPPIFIEGLRIAAFTEADNSAVSFSSNALTVLRQSSKARIARWL